MFRNVRCFQFEGAWPDSEDALSEQLTKSAFRSCGPLTERSSGFEAVAPDAGDGLARRVNGMDLLRLRTQSRVLPHAAVNEELEQRVLAFEKRSGEAPSAREKRKLKSEARDELLPKALLKSDRVWGFVDSRRGLIAIDSGQEANADRFLRRLTAAVPGLAIRSLGFNQPIEKLLARLLLGDGPKQFQLGNECRFQDLADSRAIVRCTNVDLTDPTIRNSLADGRRLTHLAIDYDNILSLVLSMDGVMTKLKWLAADDDGDDLDALARMDANFVLLTGVFGNLLKDLEKALGGLA